VTGRYAHHGDEEEDPLAFLLLFLSFLVLLRFKYQNDFAFVQWITCCVTATTTTKSSKRMAKRQGEKEERKKRNDQQECSINKTMEFTNRDW
jgi:hypothetical protein